MILIFLSLVTVNATAALSSACDQRSLAAARDAFARARAVAPTEIELKYADDGVTTAVDRDNWTSAKFTMKQRGRSESVIYLVSARQVAATPDCRVLSAVEIETRTWTVDRTADAARLAGPAAPENMLRALEAIDLDVTGVARPFARATIDLLEGDSAVPPLSTITVRYRLGWGECQAECPFTREVIVRYTRGFTAPRLDIVRDEGSPWPTSAPR